MTTSYACLSIQYEYQCLVTLRANLDSGKADTFLMAFVFKRSLALQHEFDRLLLLARLLRWRT